MPISLGNLGPTCPLPSEPVSLWAAGLTVIDHRHPCVQLALVQHRVKVAALDVAEGGAARGAGLQVAEPEAFPLAHAVLALVLGPVRRAR